MGNLVKYGEWSVEQAQAELAEVEKLSSSGGNFLTLKEGDNVIRFIPPKIGQKSPFRIVMQHYLNIPGVERAVVFACPRHEQRQPCPACQEADKLNASGNPADRDAAFSKMAKMRVYANVIDREEPERGPLILGFGKTTYEPLIKLRNAKHGGNFVDPTEGFDIVINRDGEGRKTKYSVTPARKNSPLGDMSWIEQQADLERFAQSRSYDELKAAMRGESMDDEPRSKSRREEAPPKSTRGTKKRTADDDIVDAEFDSDEDI